MTDSIVKKYSLIVVSLAAIIIAMSFKPSPAGKLIIHFENYVGDKKLALDTAAYTNALGQAFTVTNFKYYISNIRIEGTDGNIYKGDSYYLIRQDDEGTWTAAIDDVPQDSYSKVTFMIGVDSLHNCSGAQSGALDPINGMFWTWHTGYVFMKLEGKSPASKSPGHIFEYHIGGYKNPTNFIRTASLLFDKEPLKVNTGKITRLYIKTDAAKILQGKNKISFSELSSVTDFHHAGEIADNYSAMFSFIRMSNE
jgi:hypothetical protein